MKKTLLSLLLSAILPLAVNAQLIINEVMQSNIDCIMDDLNEFPDSWVELYNNGEAAINLKDYKIGLTNKPSEAWALPNKSIGVGTFALIYCDKEENGLHTNFRVDSGKGSVYLFRGNEVVDKLDLKKQPAPNIAYGRKTDGADEWGYQAKPTPGKKNCGETCSEVLGNPVFSIPGRVYNSSSTIRLALTLPEGTPEGTTIRLTTDGSEPTETSLAYSSPIKISSSKVIRAKLFCPGYLSPRSTTQSYIFLGRKQSLPVISITTNRKYLYDDKIGIYVTGTYKNGTANYKFDWRRPINIEMYETDGTTCALNQLCEARVQGGATRDNQIKAMAFYANKRFGEKRFNYEFFPDQKPGLKNFKSFLLRTAGNDFNGLYMRDAIIQRTMTAHGVDLDWQAWRPAIIYFNGEYLGLENIRERSNDDNIFSNYDELEDIDMFENWWDLKAGTWDNYNKFKAFYNDHGHTMAEYEKWMDCKEFINLMVMNLFYCNIDFPGNNIVMWRPRTEDGRWRWIAKDTDFGLGLYNRSVNYNTIKWIYDHNYDPGNSWANEADHTRLFRRLMEDPDFNREFIDHCLVYMGDFMNERGTREVWDPMYELIKDEYKVHHDNLNPWWPNYDEEMRNARNWIAQRPEKFYVMLRDYFKLGTLTKLTVNKGLSKEDQQSVTVNMNGIDLSTGYFEGKFFQNRKLTLSAKMANGEPVYGWKIITSTSKGMKTELISEPTYTFTMPQCTNMSIEALLDPDGIEDVRATLPHHCTIIDGELCIDGVAPGKQIAIYDLSGILRHSCRSNGSAIRTKILPGHSYIVRIGSEVFKVK